MLKDANLRVSNEELFMAVLLSLTGAICEQIVTLASKNKRDKLLETNTIIECTAENNQCSNIAADDDAASLPKDYILKDSSDLSSMEPEVLQCSSCNSAKAAISHCNDCANYLCVGCDNAHKNMHCFENHRVSILDNLSSFDEKDATEMPIFCTTHNDANIKYYCFTCQMPVCDDCVADDHNGIEHHYESIDEAEKSAHNYIEDLVTEAESKITLVDEELSELQSEHAAARRLILDTYEGYKKKLDECHERSLEEINRLQAEKESKIMDHLHNVKNCIQEIETNKSLQSANAFKFLCMKKQIGTQLDALIAGTPTDCTNISLEFNSTVEIFERMASDTFGQYQSESMPSTYPDSTLTLNKSNMPWNSPHSASIGGSVTANGSIPFPTPKQYLFDDNVFHMEANSLVSPCALTPDAITMQQSTESNFIQPDWPIISSEILLSKSINELLSSERSAMPAEPIVIPNAIDQLQYQSNPAPSFTLADIILNEKGLNNNLQALCELGSFSNNDLFASSMLNYPPDSVSLLPDFSLNENMNGPMGNSGIDGISGISNIGGRMKSTSMKIRYKFGQLGPSPAKFNSPHGFCLGINEEIIVADTNNHRIQILEKDGTFKMQFGEQ